MTKKYQAIIENIVRWGKSSEKIFAAVIIGSQSRTENPADDYSDLDIILFVDDPKYFLETEHWLENIGKPRITFIEGTIAGQKERRILFENALDVDFVILPKEIINSAVVSEAITIFTSGYEILVDKIGLSGILSKLNMMKEPVKLLSEKEFQNTVNDFWYHTVWTLRKLKRGEIWTAIMCLNSHIKQRLLRIIENYAKLTHGPGYNTWHNGRFIEEWTEPWINEKLRFCFSNYNDENCRTALLATMDLFRKVAEESAALAGFHYPKDADEYVTMVVKSML